MSKDLVRETISIRREQATRLRMLREAMEEKLGRRYTMNELFQHIVDDFLDTLATPEDK